MTAPRPTRLRHRYYVSACGVLIGDETPWGAVVAVECSTSAFGQTELTVRGSDGAEAVQHLDRSKRIPLCAMHDPVGRGAPGWAVPPSFTPSGVSR